LTHHRQGAPSAPAARPNPARHESVERPCRAAPAAVSAPSATAGLRAQLFFARVVPPAQPLPRTADAQPSSPAGSRSASAVSDLWRRRSCDRRCGRAKDPLAGQPRDPTGTGSCRLRGPRQSSIAPPADDPEPWAAGAVVAAGRAIRQRAPAGRRGRWPGDPPYSQRCRPIQGQRTRPRRPPG
jgi:hypothetical protein